MSEKWKERCLSILAPIGLIAIWELTVRAGLLDVRLFPLPSQIAVTLFKLVVTGELWVNLWASFSRLFYGFVLGAIPGLVLGILMGLSRYVRILLNPLVSATYPIPRSAMYPFLLILLGLDEAPKIAMVGISVFFLVLINTAAGVMGIEKMYLEVGRNLKASRWQTFVTIALPGALPLIMTGMKLGIGIGLIVLVIAESTATQTGIGYMIWESWPLFQIDRMYAALIVISLLGWLTTVLMDEIEHLVVPWRRGR